MAHHRQTQESKNLTIILLPSRAPELNPVENIWQMRANWLSNRVFEDYNGSMLDAKLQAHRTARNHQINRNAKMGRISVNDAVYLAPDNFGTNFPVKQADRRPGPYPYYGASGIVDHVHDYLFDGSIIAEDSENLRTRHSQLPFSPMESFG